MEHRIPFLDLGRLHGSIEDQLRKAFESVTAASRFVGGDEVASFEAAFAEAHSRRGTASCGNGTDALALGLRALGVGLGDEVVVPAMTFVATLEAVVHVGATPVIADVDPVTLLLTPETVGEVRTERTRAVLPVHLYGHVVPFSSLEGWRNDGLIVLEDAAQAHLATWRGRHIGEVGQAACFSFYPGKNLGALGDGGAVVSDNLELIEEVRRLRDHGSATKYVHDRIGWCSRLDGLQAAFLEVKLAHLAEWTHQRQRLAERYRERLGDLLVPWQPGAVHHVLVARVGSRRDDVRADLLKHGIESGIHYPVALSDQPACRPWARPCPHAERSASEIVSLPMDPLMTEDEVELVCSTLHEILEDLGAG